MALSAVCWRKLSAALERVAADELRDAVDAATSGLATADGAIVDSVIWNAPDDHPFFVATRAFRIAAITARILVAGTDAGAVTAVVKKAPSATAIASGTAVHQSSIDLKGTANANQALSLSATEADYTLAAGDCLGLDVTGTTTAARGVLTVTLTPI